MSTAVRWSASLVAFVHSGCGAYAAAAADLMAAIGPEFMREQIAQLQTHRGGKLRELKLDAALGAHFELNLSKAHVDMLNDIAAPLAQEYGIPMLGRRGNLSTEATGEAALRHGASKCNIIISGC